MTCIRLKHIPRLYVPKPKVLDNFQSSDTFTWLFKTAPETDTLLINSQESAITDIFKSGYSRVHFTHLEVEPRDLNAEARSPDLPSVSPPIHSESPPFRGRTRGTHRRSFRFPPSARWLLHGFQPSSRGTPRPSGWKRRNRLHPTISPHSQCAPVSPQAIRSQT